MPMLMFHSTNGQAPRVGLRDALINGQAPDRGLYMPDAVPRLALERVAAFARMEYPEIAFEILSRYADGVVEPSVLRALCEDAYNYPVPVERVEAGSGSGSGAAAGRAHVLRLDRGPTASFKDFAARMMARLLGRFVREDGGRLTILTATSGDTGSAVASAFHGLPGIQVVVLFPLAEVSDRQRRQMTTLGGNIRAIVVDGKFDDCQAMVKRAFADADLAGLSLSSANSINIGRLLPQSVYYFYAASRVVFGPSEPVVVVVPSGNFGDMMGCVLAREMGLAVRRLVVPVNENDEFPAFLATGDYSKIEPSLACLSNAMNVGHPSNLARLVEIYGGHLDEAGKLYRVPDMAAMRRDLFSTSVSDARTRQAIRRAWDEHKLLLEPHGAVGWQGYLDYLEANPGEALAPAIVVETAHPAKFPDEIQRLLGITPDLPSSLAGLDALDEHYDRMANDYAAFKALLLKEYAA
jgi:threonine synthase